MKQKIDLESRYSNKVRELFELGREPLMSRANYGIYKKYNFTKDDIEELIELALDESYYEVDYEKYEKESDRAFYATIHAANVLALLKAKEAIPYLLRKMELENGENDFFTSAIIDFFANLGEEGIDVIEEYIKNNPQSEVVLTVVEMLKAILKKHPHTLERIEDILVGYLKSEKTEATGLAFAISILVDYTKDKHIDLIREVFETKDVDTFFAGDLEDIEIELGLRDKRSKPREKNPLQKLLEEYELRETLESFLAESKPKIGRNEPCPCGSGKKYKKCCLNK